jgi:integrase
VSSIAIVTPKVERALAGLRDGYSPATAVWLRWQRETGHGVDPAGLEAWLKHLDELPLSTNTRNVYLKATKHRMHWLLARASVSPAARRAVLATLSSIRYAKAATKPVVALTPEEMRAIVVGAPTKRLSTLLEFICTVGSRVSETLNIRVSELAAEDGTKLVRVLLHGKGSKNVQTRDRFVWVPAALLAKIRKAWGDSGEYLFARGGKRYTRNYVSTAVRRISARVVGRPVGVHALRHGWATDAVWNRHADLTKVAAWLGHGSVRTSERYYLHGSLGASDAATLVATL